MDQVHIPDPVAQQLSRMEEKMAAMEQELARLKAEQADAATADPQNTEPSLSEEAPTV
jgi:hypothetical protein